MSLLLACNHGIIRFAIGLPEASNLVLMFKELKSFCFELKYTEINKINYKNIKGRYFYTMEIICILCPSLCIICTCRHLHKCTNVKKKGRITMERHLQGQGSLSSSAKGAKFPAANDRFSRHQGTVPIRQ